jgi:molybdenum cofactor cytidylyltransferase
VGHPFAFHRSLFPLLAQLHGDKAVWKLLAQHAVVEVAIPGPIPLDVDTEDDYRQVLAVLRSTP